MTHVFPPAQTVVLVKLVLIKNEKETATKIKTGLSRRQSWSPHATFY
jgi:hypothetical protein